MPSRKTSSEIYYPFTPATIDAERVVVEGVKDIFIMIQGEPDATGQPDLAEQVTLDSYTVSAGDRIYQFTAAQGTVRWTFTVTVAANTGTVEAGTSHATVFAVMIVDTNNIPGITNSPLTAPLEPARVQWYAEQIDKITISNIHREDGFEDSTILIPLSVFDPADPLPFDIKIADGYNLEWAVVDGKLTVDADQGIGQGVSPDWGDTVNPPDPPTESDGIWGINGLRPINGNIELQVSDSLLVTSADGIITISERQ